MLQPLAVLADAADLVISGILGRFQSIFIALYDQKHILLDET